ncbi:MAG: phosphomethylpyrimidine synthase ThiC [Phascolarctobacterium sp.]|nr:phosphomethylpyrimidine synthase ThiC [Phascolarctobacterium sp.]
MATQMQLARKGMVTDAMEEVARRENVNAEFIRSGAAEGTIAICANKNHKTLFPAESEEDFPSR